MAGKAIAAFFLLVTLSQVRAAVDCYSVTGCPAADAAKYVASSARECCLDGLPAGQTRGYSTVGDSTDCAECIVIGFSPNKLTLDEETEQTKTVKVRPLTSASSAISNSQVEYTIQATQSGTDARFGSDLKIDGGNEATIMKSAILSRMDEDLELQTLNDDDTGEIEYFVLVVTPTKVTNQETGDILEAFSGPSLNVTIADDDIIHVEFEVTEYQVNEDQGNLAVSLKISNSIPAATHFVVRPMTYQDYDNKFPNLTKKYPDIKPYSLNDEYDQAELEDFNSTVIPFTIPANSPEQSRNIIVNVFPDDTLEPAEEGFRLVLEVDESKGTRLSEVTFGRQIALCRIDNIASSFKFGFELTTKTINDTARTFDVELALHIVSGTTEIPFNLTFATGDQTSATLGQDYNDFSASEVYIQPPANFQPGRFLSLTVNGDDVFEGDEVIEVILEYDLDLPKPFRPKHINETSEYGSIVDPPSTGSIGIDNRTAQILIKEVVPENTAELSMPKVIREGDSFVPLITVSHKVNAIFRVYTPAGQGTATKDTDFSFANQDVSFDPTSLTNPTSSPVATMADDIVEPNETFLVSFYVSSPSGIANLIKTSNPNETITIVDQNSATIGFEIPSKIVHEYAGPVVLNVKVDGDQLGDNAEVVVRFYTTSGTAESGIDFEAVDKQLTFNGTQQQIAVEIPIIDDDLYEPLPNEMFQANLELVSSNVDVPVDSTTATVTIIDGDPQPTKECTLYNSLNLNTFSNEQVSGTNMDISMGCERKLVTSCDPDVDLEIRVDFFQDDFDSIKVAIFYEEQKVTMDENFVLNPATPPSTDFEFSKDTMSASVSILDIDLTVSRNRTQLTISTDNDTLVLAGLCGNLTGNLVYPDCTDIYIPGSSMDEFIHSFKVKPSDQVLRGERKACGVTTNDTIISDPLMTVPIHAAGFPSDLNLCYEIHGAADRYFNLVSDECTTVNAHYERAEVGSELNIIDSISVVAIDTEGKCHDIVVDSSDCIPVVDSDKKKRRRRSTTSVFEENGVSVRCIDSRVRISVPNCEDNELVMWVVCQNQSLYDQDRDVVIEDVEMIKFEIARGLNLKETSHGLLGQFWNIPINVTQYNGPFAYTVDSADKYYTVEVHYPNSPVRSFVGFMFDVTWEWKHKHCIYAGDRQGGPAGEVERDGSVIEGTYEDYVMSDPFGTQFIYGVFKQGVC